jgi:UDP-N-acetylmuramoyl-L-alanyl-D-glutamate--2,6-diaminopimelate ligase
MLNKILRTVEKFIPRKLFTMAQPAYHYTLAFTGALIYRFPSKSIKVVAVTGTKGKTSTVELVNTILEEAGYKTALAGTLRFKIGHESKANLYKMTMPGRFFIQKFLRDAVNAGCEYVVLEISSEAAKQHRNKFIDLDALLFTNLAPEHIESHGSYEKYVDAKLSIARALVNSPKENKVLIVNSDDKEGEKFLGMGVENKISYSMKDAESVALSNDLTTFTYKGIKIESELLGKFNIYNMLAAIKYAESQDIDLKTIAAGILKLKNIKGRAEKIDLNCDYPDTQDFKVIVDYAHTPESLIAIYETFPESKKIGVLGSCGGGRDKWKRKVMAEIADKYCAEVILTDEDPYNDDPREIVDDMAQYFKNKKPQIVMDRRVAIHTALKDAKAGDVVIITGKGTDPYIMRKNGVKEKWSDAEVVREELRKILKTA